MGILDDLAKLHQSESAISERQYCDDWQFSIHDDIFRLMLSELSVASDIIDDLMLEPVKSRDDWILYFRGKNEK